MQPRNTIANFVGPVIIPFTNTHTTTLVTVHEQEAIELHEIEALQPWMHGSLDRAEAERRLKHTRTDGAFLVRMKGKSGRMCVLV